MPIVTGEITQDGAIISVLVGVSRSRHQRLLKVGLPVPETSRGDEARPSSSPLNLTGIWAGELASIPGTPRMIWTLSESGTSVTGAVQVILPNGVVVLNGTVAGTIVDTMLTYAITVPPNGIFLAPACSGQLTGSAEATPTTLTGTASPGTISCVLPISTIGFVLAKS